MARTSNYQGGDAVTLTGLYGALGGILERNYQQAQQQAQAEQKRADKIYDSISAEAAKVNPDSLRNADYEGFQAMYQEQIKAPMIDALLARQSGDMATYAQKMAEVNAGIGTVNSFISRSKQESKFDYDLAEDIRKNPDRYSDQSIELYRTRIATPTTALSGNLQQGSEAWIRQVDTSKVQGQIDSVLDGLFKNSAKLSGINPTRVMAGGRGADVVQFEEAIDKNVFAESVEMRFASDPAWRAFAEQNNLGKTPEEAAINLTAAYEAAGRFQRTDGRQIVRDQALSQSGGTQTPGDISLTYGAPVHFGPNNNSRIVTGKSATLDVKNKSIEGADGVDLTTGQRTAVPSGTYSVTGVYAMPVLNRDIRYKANPSAPTTTIKAGNFATGGADGSPTSQDVTYKDFIIVMNESKNLIGETTTKRYAIPRDRLPSSLLADNKIKAAVSAYDQTPVAPGYKQESPQNSVSLTDNSTKPKLSW